MDPFERDSIAARLAPSSDATAWIESIGFLSVAFAIGLLTKPDDPLFTDANFPWPLVVPVLIGLRYGFAHAFVNAALLHILALGYAYINPESPWPIPVGYSFGVLIISMLAGEFRDLWQDRIETLEQSNEYRQARLEEFTHAFHILKTSHDRLEQANAGNQSSLRSALIAVGHHAEETETMEESCSGLLDLLHNYCAVQSATIYREFDADSGALSGPIASIGRGCTPNAEDVLVTMAVTRAEAAHVDANAPGTFERKDGDPLICLPLVDVYQTMHAIVVIDDIPFFSYHEENLQLMSIIAASVSDYMSQQVVDAELADIGAPSREFGRHIRRCLKNYRDNRIAFSLVVFKLPHTDDGLGYAERIVSETRGLDLTYMETRSDQLSLYVLMPLTVRQGVEQYLRRFSGYMARAFGSAPRELDVEEHAITMAKGSSHDEFVDFVGLHADPAAHLLEAIGTV